MPVITREKAIEIAGKTHWMLPEAISRRDKTIPCAERLGEQERTSSFGPKYFETIDSAREHVEDVLYRYDGGESLLGHQWRNNIRPVLQTMRHRFFGIKPTPNYPFKEHKLPPLMTAPIHFGVGQDIYVLAQPRSGDEISITKSQISSVTVKCDFGVMAYGYGKNSYLAKPGVEISEAEVNSLRLDFEYASKIHEPHVDYSGRITFCFNKHYCKQDYNFALDAADDYARVSESTKVFFTIAAIENYLDQTDRRLTVAKDRIRDAQIHIIPQLKEGLHNTHS